jgi:hypothetical protein
MDAVVFVFRTDEQNEKIKRKGNSKLEKLFSFRPACSDRKQ